MNFTTPVGPHDEGSKIFNAFFQDADAGFLGVDERTPPQWLAQGYAAAARNKRFRMGRAQDRGGIVICRWGKGDGTVPFDEVYGAGLYGSPGGTNTIKWILIAADGGVWKTRPGNVATPVPLPAGIELEKSSFSQFVQCMNVMILLRGQGLPALAMSDIDIGFLPITQTAAGIAAGTTPIPHSQFGGYIGNRLALITGRDFLAVSDINDYTSYQAVTETFQINQGDSDRLVAFALFNGSQVVCLKENSVYLVNGVSGTNLAGASGPFQLTDEYGCTAPFSVAVRGTNVFWVCQHGVASATLTELNQTQAANQMLSDPLTKTWARVNQLYVGGACSTVWKSRLYVGVPLDDAQLVSYNPLPFTTGLNPYSDAQYVQFYTLTPGKTYYFQPNAINTDVYSVDPLLTNVDQYTQAAGPFVAQAGVIFVSGGRNEAGDWIYPARIYPVSNGNTGVMVYDFIANAWCGTDEGPGTCPVAWVRYTYNADELLLAVCADGFIRQWDVGSEQSARCEDEIYLRQAPGYMDILVSKLPVPGDVISLDGLTALTVTAAAVNTADTWGCQTLALAQQNLWSDGVFGMDPNLGAASWAFGSRSSVPSMPLAGGARFTLGPSAPVLTRNGQPFSGLGPYLFADIFQGWLIQSTPVQSSLTTRAYSCLDHDGKRFISLLALGATWHPRYSITTLVNGANQTTEYVADAVKDRTLYDVQDLAPYDLSNAHGDHAAAKRLDYSVCLDEGAAGGAAMNLDAGPVNPDLAQDTLERLAVDEKGLWMQVRFDNSSGTHEVRAMLMEVMKADRESGAHV